MLKVKFRPEARKDIYEAHFWYESRRIGLGEEFFLCVESSIEHIRRNPKLYRDLEAGIRRALVPRFPYGIYYRAKGENITIYGILHLKMDAKNWKNRIKE